MEWNRMDQPLVIFLILQKEGMREVKWESDDIPDIKDGREEGGKDGGAGMLKSECSVCGSPAAAHLHYGAISCYSCRAFFRRGPPRQVRSVEDDI
jgi:hypothetical protein